MAKAKRQPTAGDMIRSLAVLLVPLLVIAWFFTVNVDDYPVEAIDWQPVYTQAKDEADYAVLAPQNLPPEWMATRVAWEPDAADGQRWLSGWLDPRQTYFAVEQSDPGGAGFIARVTRDGNPDGASTVSGQTWQRYLSADERTYSLVLPGDGVTTIVVSDSSYEALESFASTLG